MLGRDVLDLNNLPLGYVSLQGLMRSHPTTSYLALWAIAMLSYYQDATRRHWGFGVISQVIGYVSLISIAVMGFMDKRWPDFVIAPVMIALQVWLTRRWSRRGSDSAA